MTARRFSALSLLIVVMLSAVLPAWAQTGGATSGVYYPGAEWLHKTPAEVGISAARLKDAIDFAIAAETKAPRDLKLNHYQTFGREPFGYAIGPIKDRGEPTGIIVYNGYIVAEWGEPVRVDMTHSVTKSFLSSVVGVAVDRGMIRSIDDPVARTCRRSRSTTPAPADEQVRRLGTSDLMYLFDAPHNRTITWDHLLRQTSDWQGTLWGKPDWADRPGGQARAEWPTRTRDEPGTAYKYNDVRVNVLALAALNVWRRPLPQVLKENVMDPIGASTTWRWYGYENSWVELDGALVQSVTRRRALGRRHVHQRVRHGALRLSSPAQRQVEGPPDRVGAVDRWALTPTAGPADLRLHELVPQHRSQAPPQRAGRARSRTSATAPT